MNRDRCVQGPVVVEELFRGALIREQRRADRSKQQLLLVSISLPQTANGQHGWAPVIDALRAITRETDITGWLDAGRTLSVILPAVQGSTTQLASQLRARVQQELSKRCGDDTLDSFSVAVSLHPGQADVSEDAAGVFSPLPAFHFAHERRGYSAVKRVLDVLCSLALLAFLSPVFLVVAVLVKLTSSGPVFFRQSRIGYLGKPFPMLKFRTMRVNADSAVHQQFVTNFIKSGARQDPATPGFFKIARDPRVTSIGRILRKTSLDELPQLWNVFCGDMSLVGPRPPLQYEVEQYEAWHRRRVLEAKPGITGLWQVTGRSRTTFDDMVRLDLRYAKTCSLSTDVKILLATPAAVISGKGAC